MLGKTNPDTEQAEPSFTHMWKLKQSNALKRSEEKHLPGTRESNSEMLTKSHISLTQNEDVLETYITAM